MANTYLQRTPTTNGSFVTNTWSFWLKRASLGGDQILWSSYVTPTNNFNIKFTSGDKFQFGYYAGIWDFQVVTNRLFKDTSAWYNIVIAQDASDSTSTDRLKIYVNGVRETSFAITNFPDLNEGSNTINATNSTTILGQSGNSSEYFNGSMSHINFVDGTAYDATAFGEYDANGVWKIKTSPSVTYGTNGFFILKDGNSVTDQSGNSNNFTVGGGTLTKTEDNPSNVFATLNPLDIDTALSYTFAKGNTDVTIAESGGEGMSKATLGVSSGKYYFECKLVSSSVHGRFGVVSTATPSTVNPGEFGIAWQMNDATMQLVNSVVSGSWGSNPSNNDILMFALDCDNQAFYFGVNGTWRNSGNPTSGASRTGGVNYSGQSTLTSDFLTVGFGGNFFGGGGVQQGQYNFGNGYFGTTAVASAGTNASGIGIFEYDVPTGYTALSTKGLNL